MLNKAALKYIGAGQALIGIPARDLNEDEVEVCGGAEYLVSTGLYAQAESPEAQETPESIQGAGKLARREKKE